MTRRPAPLPPDMAALLDPLGDEAHGLREVWTLVGDPPAADRAETDRSLVRLREAVAGEPARPGDAPPDRPRRALRPAAARPGVGSGRAPRVGRAAWRLLGTSAAVVLTAVAAWTVWGLQPVTVTAPAGAPTRITLADGTAVTLNSGSALRAPRRFGRVREVDLVGEAYLDVARSGVPFVLTTPDAEVAVLGTRFGVRAWPARAGEAGGTTVALVEGSVRLRNRARPGRAVVLAPGDVRRVAGASPPAVVAATPEAVLAWRAGDFVYKDRPLGEILADVERRFGIALTASPELARRRVSVALRAPAGAEPVVRDLALAFSLRYRARADGFDLFAAGPDAGPVP